MIWGAHPYFWKPPSGVPNALAKIAHEHVHSTCLHINIHTYHVWCFHIYCVTWLSKTLEKTNRMDLAVDFIRLTNQTQISASSNMPYLNSLQWWDKVKEVQTLNLRMEDFDTTLVLYTLWICVTKTWITVVLFRHVVDYHDFTFFFYPMTSPCSHLPSKNCTPSLCPTRSGGTASQPKLNEMVTDPNKWPTKNHVLQIS